MMFTFLEHELNLGILTQLPRPLFKLSLNFLSSNPRQRETTHSPGDSLSRNCFPQQKQGVEERLLVEFSLKLVYSTMCGKKFQIYDVHIPRT